MGTMKKVLIGAGIILGGALLLGGAGAQQEQLSGGGSPFAFIFPQLRESAGGLDTQPLITTTTTETSPTGQALESFIPQKSTSIRETGTETGALTPSSTQRTRDGVDVGKGGLRPTAENIERFGGIAPQQPAERRFVKTEDIQRNTAIDDFRRAQAEGR